MKLMKALIVALVLTGAPALAQTPPGSAYGGATCTAGGYINGDWLGNYLAGNLLYNLSGQVHTAKVGALGVGYTTCPEGALQGDGACLDTSTGGDAQATGLRGGMGVGGRWTTRFRLIWPGGSYVSSSTTSQPVPDIEALCPAQPPCPPGQCGTPIVIPTKQLVKAGQTVRFDGSAMFDLDGDGAPERLSWLSDGGGYLALDRNGNGVIDDGRELFGTANGFGNGFEDLAAVADTLRTAGGYLDGSHPLWEKLLVWTDDGDGISQPNELAPLDRHLLKIGLGFVLDPLVDDHGNQFKIRGWAEYKVRGEGDYYPIYDVFLVRQ